MNWLAVIKYETVAKSVIIQLLRAEIFDCANSIVKCNYFLD